MSDLRILYVTAADADEALRIGRALVEARLAACANVLPGMTSIYRWEGRVEQAAEAVLVLKTRASLVEAATERSRPCTPTPARASWRCRSRAAIPITWT